MPSKKEGLIVLYPEYFDKALSRAQGRRVPRAIAVSKPTTKMISNAARKLGFQNKVEDNAHFSSKWFDKRGRVLILSKVDKEGNGFTKAELVAKIGKRIRERERRVAKI